MGCKQTKVLDDHDETATTEAESCFPAEVFCDKQTILENYQCPIMWGVLNNPVKGRCGHTFCYYCISTSFGIDGRKRCPVCRQDLGRLVKDNNLKNKIGKLSAKCPHPNCAWTGTLKKLQQHIIENCRHKKIKCGFCDAHFQLPEELAHHKSEDCRLRSLSHLNIRPVDLPDRLNVSCY